MSTITEHERSRTGRRAPARRGGLKSVFFSQKAAPYIFVLPFIVTFLVFWGFPIARSVAMSFEHIVPGRSYFVGLGNFERMFGDRIFWVAVTNSLRYMLVTLVLLIPIPLTLAVLVNSKIGSPRIKSFFKAAMFVPALTSVVVAGIIFRLIFSESSTALMNQALGLIGLDPVRWLRSGGTALVALVAIALWRWTGVNMMYFLAALQSVPQEYYEAAELDGAGRFKTFIHVTLPSIRPTIVFVTTISIFGGLAMFVEAFMLWGGASSPNNVGLTIVGYLYSLGVQRGDMGYASAVGVVLLLAVLIINFTQLTLTGFFKKDNR
ncbi:sugar ABC transporter permease [Xylanimonas allomyrinae]|uniref:Sugar ABC transporter permease n=1 Tax=Xylanimonas allomyrinae TaxID=2509459 RepID=A0A4P6EMV2_9MICO|nr:sugar ABC transporter permease [Xylanimonas allomyrinae]QAY64210.1 sugar ABC transporter permease [Xylanimonas allomyrinae]